MKHATAQQLSPILFLKSYVNTFLLEFRQGIRHHGLLMTSGSAVFLFGYVLSHISGYMLAASPITFLLKFVLLAGVIVGLALLTCKVLHMFMIERPLRPLNSLANWLLYNVLSPSRLANGVHGMLFVFLVMGGFTMAKNNISRFGGFHWDAEFSPIDHAMHFGFYPHELLAPLFGSQWPTVILDQNYLLWFPMVFAACFLAAFQHERSFERHRFLLALFFTWGIGGTLFALIFSSAGPVYFHAVTGLADPYAQHFARLRYINSDISLRALEIQDRLWSHLHGQPSISLISAMPSMHSAISMLVCLACWRQGLIYGFGSTVFTILILIGSVHLGWHYALDTYAGIVLAVVAWHLSAPLSRWYIALPQTASEPR